MIYHNGSTYTFHTLRASFLDEGRRRIVPTSDRQHWEKMVGAWGHLSDLSFERIEPTEDQQARLDSLPAGLDESEAALYVEWGTTSPEGPHYGEALYLEAMKARVAPDVEVQRKRVEAQGVIHNGIRYSGSPANRQALLECVQLAEETGKASFATWKDSDGKYHADVSVDDVKAALMQIADRRDHLIGLEGQYVAQVAAGELDVHELDWTTEHD